jgi:hypothetical protein
MAGLPACSAASRSPSWTALPLPTLKKMAPGLQWLKRSAVKRWRVAGGGQHADDDIGLGQHLVECRQLVHLIEPGTLTATVADAEHPHAKMLSGVGDMLPYAAGAEQQQRLPFKP